MEVRSSLSGREYCFILSTDLCSKNKVTGYPQMNLYKDGQFVETFKQGRDLDILQKYLADHAEPTTPLSPPVPEITNGAKTEEVPVVPAVPAKVYNPSGSVTVLNEKTFADAIQEGHVFIKYYAPWYVSRGPLYSRLTVQQVRSL